MSKNKKKSVSFKVKPSPYAACVELAESHIAGALLYQVFIRSRKGTLKDEKGSAGWLVMGSSQWRVLTRSSRSQHNDAIRALKDRGLIEWRRRRLTWADAAVFTWVRISDTAKSGIAEIMARPGISAFGEDIDDLVSDNTEIKSPAISVETELLYQNDILKNENIENVIITATTKTEEGLLSKEKDFQKNEEKQKKQGKQETDKNGGAAAQVKTSQQYYAYINRVYDGTTYTIDPLSESSLKTLNRMIDYLSKNPGAYYGFCSQEERDPCFALNQVTRNWEEFAWFAMNYHSGYSMSSLPTVWSMGHQLKAVPDFIKYRKFMAEAEKALSEAGIKTSDSMREKLQKSGKHEEYLKATIGKRPTVISEAIALYIKHAAHQKKQDAKLASLESENT